MKSVPASATSCCLDRSRCALSAISVHQQKVQSLGGSKSKEFYRVSDDELVAQVKLWRANGVEEATEIPDILSKDKSKKVTTLKL